MTISRQSSHLLHAAVKVYGKYLGKYKSINGRHIHGCLYNLGISKFLHQLVQELNVCTVHLPTLYEEFIEAS